MEARRGSERSMRAEFLFGTMERFGDRWRTRRHTSCMCLMARTAHLKWLRWVLFSVHFTTIEYLLPLRPHVVLPLGVSVSLSLLIRTPVAVAWGPPTCPSLT